MYLKVEKRLKKMKKVKLNILAMQILLKEISTKKIKRINKGIRVEKKVINAIGELVVISA